jgi:hypothetical protein
MPKMRSSYNKSENGGHMAKWLNAMKAQSPPRSHPSSDESFDLFDAKAAEYAAWKVQFPMA